MRNACWRLLRTSRAESQSAFDEEEHSGAVIDLPQAGPERELLRTLQARRINDAVAALAPEFREVFVLRELEGLSYKEIAGVAGIPMGTVMSRLSRARSELQKRLVRERPRERMP